MPGKNKDYFQIRTDPELKKAVKEYCEQNFVSESVACRMAIAQFPPIKEILEKNRKEKSPKEE